MYSIHTYQGKITKFTGEFMILIGEEPHGKVIPP